MFVISIRAGKKQILLAVGVLLALILAVVLLVRGAGEATAANARFQTAGGSAAERKLFLQQFGWEIEQEPIEVCEVIIPELFNEAYTAYNELQKSQGFDLSKYCGKRVKRWTYLVTNYPEEGKVYANLLVAGGKVVGGDIGSAEKDGFVRSFLPSGT